jgi:hypothetical protein
LACLVSLNAAGLAERWIERDMLINAAKAVGHGKHPDAALTFDSERLDEQLKLAKELERLVRASQPLT